MCKGHDLSHLTLSPYRGAWFHILRTLEALGGEREEAPLVGSSDFIGCLETRTAFPWLEGAKEPSSYLRYIGT